MNVIGAYDIIFIAATHCESACKLIRSDINTDGSFDMLYKRDMPVT